MLTNVWCLLHSFSKEEIFCPLKITIIPYFYSTFRFICNRIFISLCRIINSSPLVDQSGSQQKTDDPFKGVIKTSLTKSVFSWEMYGKKTKGISQEWGWETKLKE